MSRFPPTIVAVFAGLLLSGCAATWPWSAGNAETSHFQAPVDKGEPGDRSKADAGLAAASPADAGAAAQADVGRKSNAAKSAALASTTPGKPAEDPVAMPYSAADARRQQAMMAQLRQLRATEPAAEDELLGRLQQTDPSLWPLVVDQFSATLAYRREMYGAQTADSRDKGVRSNYPERPVACFAEIGPAPFSPTRLPPVAAGTADGPGNRAAVTDAVQPASYGAPVGSSSAQQLAQTIAALERETPTVPNTPGDLADCARLRMLYTVAGRREDAARPIPGAPPAVQGFVAKEMEGLGTWLDAGRVPDAGLRAVASKPALSEALVKLGDSAPLVIRNLAFCSEVLGYGCLKRFDTYEFTPGQEMLVYAEVENFASEATKGGYHTSLRPSYQILDSQGRWVSDHALGATDETCPNLRHDYFLSFRLRLPQTVALERHTLRLTIADNVSRKVGQVRLDFRVVGISDAKKG